MKTAVLILAILISALPCAGKVIYVDADAPGADDGTSWADAYRFLQDALTDANSAPKPVDIRVAQGVYAPDSNSALPDGTGSRWTTFQLVNGVTLKGGYVSFGNPDPGARDIAAYETVLSGDINIPDVNTDNSYHVVTGSGTDSTAVLDGFTITSGYANASAAPDNTGAGMYNNNGSPTVTNCTFTRNMAYYGSGMANCSESEPTLLDCTFVSNPAIADDILFRGQGGGMWNADASSPTLERCAFTTNSAVSGGGMVNYYCTPTLTNCSFTGNSAEAGAGMFNWSSNATVTDCTFSGNLGGFHGGGIFNHDSSPTVSTCTFTGNSALLGGGMFSENGSHPAVTSCIFSGNSATGTKSWDGGGGMFNAADCNPTLTNCMFVRNTAIQTGGAMKTYTRCNPTVTNCTFAHNSAPDGTALACDSYLQQEPGSLRISNCILWDGGSEILSEDGSAVTVAYSDVRGSWPGEGNLSSDPCFADPCSGDYHLKSQAGRWDPNSETWVIDDLTSPCIDAGDPNSSIGHEPFPNGGIVNMGAYGGTSEASKSYFGKPPCEVIVAGDVNGDCDINFLDFRFIALHWLRDYAP